LIAEFNYRVDWRARGGHPGRHPGGRSGGGLDFLGHVPLASHPDPRHLDIRATLADPFGQLMVRQFRQRAAIPVYLVADLSASMGFQGFTRKTALLAELAEAVAWSAWRESDPFGFFACDGAILWELSLPLRWHKGFAGELGARLTAFHPRAGSAEGVLEVAAHLGRERALVFLASDFHWPDDLMERVLESFARHHLVPVVLWDSAEYETLPRFGLVELRDPETGARRRLFLRPRLREALCRRYAERREALTRACARHGRAPFFLIDRFDPDAMTRYFFEG